MEGDIAQMGQFIGAGLPVRRIAQPLRSCGPDCYYVHRHRVRRSLGDLLVPRCSAVDVRCLNLSRLTSLRVGWGFKPPADA